MSDTLEHLEEIRKALTEIFYKTYIPLMDKTGNADVTKAKLVHSHIKQLERIGNFILEHHQPEHQKELLE